MHSIENMSSQAHSLLAIIGPVGAGKVNNLFLVFILILVYHSLHYCSVC